MMGVKMKIEMEMKMKMITRRFEMKFFRSARNTLP